jgi:hypothetical protein
LQFLFLRGVDDPCPRRTRAEDAALTWWLGIVHEMRFRALIKQSPRARGACLVLLLLFVVICGIHIAGIHHDSDADGLSLVDRLATILLIAALAFLFVVLNTKASLVSRDPRGVHPAIFLSAAGHASSSGIVVPLRC